MSKRKKASTKPQKPWDRLGISKSTYYRKKRKKGSAVAGHGPRGSAGDLKRAAIAALSGRHSPAPFRTPAEAEAEYRGRGDGRVPQTSTSLEVIEQAVDEALVDNFLAFVGHIPADGRLIYGTARQAWAIARAIRRGFGKQPGTGS